MVFAGFLEMLSVSLMLPFIEAVMNPEKTMQNKYVMEFCKLFSIGNDRTFLVLLSLIMAAVYIIKNLFLLLQITVQNRFVYNNLFAIQQDLLRKFMTRPYEYFLSVKSGEILRIISTDTSHSFSALTSLLSFFSEMIVSAAVLVTVFIITPWMTIFIGVILLAITGLIMFFLKPVLKKLGDMDLQSFAGMNQWLLQSINGIKEAKLMRKETFFQNKYAKYGKMFSRANYLNVSLSMVPRFMIEAIAMGVFFVAIAIMIYRGDDLESIIPILSAVAMAAMRLLPAMNRISVSVSALSFREPAIDQMITNLKEVQEYKCDSCIRDLKDDEIGIGVICDSVELNNISYRYPTGSSDVLKNANMKIKKGSSIGIVGASGAGKTTVVDILLGLLRPQGGKVLVDGTDIELDMNGWLSNIGYIPQSIFMLDGSIKENVAFGIDEKSVDESAVWEALKEAAIDDFVKSLPDGLDTQIGERGTRISGGQRQRLGIARALYTNPEVLVFDEATSALDNETEQAIMDSINHFHGSKTIIIIAHRLSTIEGCDAVYRVDGGHIIQEK